MLHDFKETVNDLYLWRWVGWCSGGVRSIKPLADEAETLLHRLSGEMKHIYPLV